MTSDWEQRLTGILRKSRRLAFVGVGQDLRGDDAAGIHLVRRLQQASPETPASNTLPLEKPPPMPSTAKRHASAAKPCAVRLYFEAGLRPEASAGPLRRFGPDWVIFLDAAELGEPPGTVRWIEPQEIDDGTASTHTFPMGGFAGYLCAELGCRTAVLGIQPGRMEFDEPVSAEVQCAIEEIAGRILGG
ncbi:MAG: hydrogenase maturation protease [Anaerolineales bacterium]|nr:hydrogenase maturation protease [Anaerolineales bacterium]